MEASKMWEAVKAAVDAGQVTKKTLDPASKGSYLGKCLSGKNTPGDARVADWYERLSTLPEKAEKRQRTNKAKVENKTENQMSETEKKVENQDREPNREKTLQETIATLQDRMQELEAIAASRQAAIVRLETENAMLRTAKDREPSEQKTENKVENLAVKTENKGREQDRDHYRRFQIVEKLTKGKPYWYGYRNFNGGDKVWLYIGKDRGAAVAKIDDWCKRNNGFLPQEDRQ